MAEKSFKFRLQTILDYKQDLEDKEKEKLAKILAELQAAIANKNKLESIKAQTRIELKEKQKAGGINVDELRFYNNYLKKLDNDIVQVKMYIEQIRHREKAQRVALLEAAKQRKTYEKLKEKHKEQFDEEQAEIERKLIDEMGTIKFARKMIEEQSEMEEGESDEDNN